MEIIILIVLVLVFSLMSLRKGMIDTFKISYYEKKLELIDVDISKVKNIGLLDIWRL